MDFCGIFCRNVEQMRSPNGDRFMFDMYWHCIDIVLKAVGWKKNSAHFWLKWKIPKFNINSFFFGKLYDDGDSRHLMTKSFWLRPCDNKIYQNILLRACLYYIKIHTTWIWQVQILSSACETFVCWKRLEVSLEWYDTLHSSE